MYMPLGKGKNIPRQRHQHTKKLKHYQFPLCLHSRVGQVFLCGKTVEKLFKGISDKPLLSDFLRIINIGDGWLSKTDTITFHFVKCTI